MSTERDRMIEVLKEKVLPVLRSRGFKGTFPHFRRPTPNGIHLLTFQFDKWGGGFVVEVAACPATGMTTPWGEHVPPGKVRAWDINQRLRLGAVGKDSDNWFRYDKRGLFGRGDPYARAAEELLPMLDSQAEEWWARQTSAMSAA
jgi:hypothetical protein